MWCFMVISVLISTRGAYGSYNYLKTGIPFGLPNNGALRDTGGNVIKENPLPLRETIPYAVPYKGYQYLQQREKNENKYLSVQEDDSKLSSTNLLAMVPIQSSVERTPNSEAQNKESHLVGALNVPSFINLHKNQVTDINYQNNFALLTRSQIFSGKNTQPITSPQNVNKVIEAVEAPVLNLQHSLSSVEQNKIPTTNSFNPKSNKATLVNLINGNLPLVNLNLLSSHNAKSVQSVTKLEATIPNTLSIENNQLFSLNAPNSAPQPYNSLNRNPLITKSVSFHVPPPEIEEKPAIPHAQSLPSPQKNYKIMFIKVPSQESRFNVQVEDEINRFVPVEDKTLIYVLVKEPEVYPDPIILPQSTKPSEHEVLFVHYQDSPINNEEIK